MFCTRVAWVCLLLCKEEGSSPVSAITERRDMGLYEVPVSVFDGFWDGDYSISSCIVRLEYNTIPYFR